MARLVSQAEFARLAGVSRTAISKAVRKQLKPALVGKRLDIDHRSSKIYLAGRDDAPTSDAESDESAATESTEQRRDRPDWDSDPEEFLDLTLREITDEFHGFQGFEDWLNARKKIADIRDRDLKNDELEGALIPREGVRVHVIGLLDGTFERLVRDVPRATAARAIAAVKSGGTQEEVEALIRDAISSVLKTTKQKATRVLRDLE